MQLVRKSMDSWASGAWKVTHTLSRTLDHRTSTKTCAYACPHFLFWLISTEKAFLFHDKPKTCVIIATQTFCYCGLRLFLKRSLHHLLFVAQWCWWAPGSAQWSRSCSKTQKAWSCFWRVWSLCCPLWSCGKRVWLHPASVRLWKEQRLMLPKALLSELTNPFLPVLQRGRRKAGRVPWTLLGMWWTLVKLWWACLGIQMLGSAQGSRFIWTSKRETRHRILWLGRLFFPCPLKKKNPILLLVSDTGGLLYLEMRVRKSGAFVPKFLLPPSLQVQSALDQTLKLSYSLQNTKFSWV